MNTEIQNTNEISIGSPKFSGELNLWNKKFQSSLDTANYDLLQNDIQNNASKLKESRHLLEEKWKNLQNELTLFQRTERSMKNLGQKSQRKMNKKASQDSKQFNVVLKTSKSPSQSRSQRKRSKSRTSRQERKNSQTSKQPLTKRLSQVKRTKSRSTSKPRWNVNTHASAESPRMTSTMKKSILKPATSLGNSRISSSGAKEKESLIEFLQKENKQLQKQFIKSKSELYEVNFKNTALKNKVEKLKKDNQMFKTKLKESYKVQKSMIIDRQVENDYRMKSTQQLDSIRSVLADVLQSAFGQVPDGIYNSINYAFMLTNNDRAYQLKNEDLIDAREEEQPPVLRQITKSGSDLRSNQQSQYFDNTSQNKFPENSSYSIQRYKQNSDISAMNSAEISNMVKDGDLDHQDTDDQNTIGILYSLMEQNQQSQSKENHGEENQYLNIENQEQNETKEINFHVIPTQISVDNDTSDVYSLPERSDQEKVDETEDVENQYGEPAQDYVNRFENMMQYQPHQPNNQAQILTFQDPGANSYPQHQEQDPLSNTKYQMLINSGTSEQMRVNSNTSLQNYQSKASTLAGANVNSNYHISQNHFQQNYEDNYMENKENYQQYSGPVTNIPTQEDSESQCPIESALKLEKIKEKFRFMRMKDSNRNTDQSVVMTVSQSDQPNLYTEMDETPRGRKNIFDGVSEQLTSLSNQRSSLAREGGLPSSRTQNLMTEINNLDQEIIQLQQTMEKAAIDV